MDLNQQPSGYQEHAHDTGLEVFDWFGTGKKNLIFTEETGFLNVYKRTQLDESEEPKPHRAWYLYDLYP